MKTKTLVALLVFVIVLTLAVWGFVAGHKERAAEAKHEKPVRGTAKVSNDHNEIAISLDAISQQQSGLAVSEQAAIAHRQELKAFGTVLAVDDLIALRTSYIAAKSKVEQADAAVAATRAEFERLRALHADDQNVSLKALQAAEAAWRIDAAAQRVAQSSLVAAGQTARQQFGDALSKAAAKEAPLFAQLLSRQKVLVQTTLPAGTALARPPQEARIQISGDAKLRPAQLIGTAPRTDPRLQGPSFFYSAPSEGLLPGQTVTLFLPIGEPAPGVIIPGSAVVWWQGRPWVYTRNSPERFVRRELPADNPIDEGWFVHQGFANGEPVVTAGAQLLLSEELRAQISVGEDGGSKP